MTQKTALVLSVVLTAFLLVVGGGVIARMSQPEAASAAAPDCCANHCAVRLSACGRYGRSSAGTHAAA